MNRFFQPDSGVMRFFGHVADTLLLNLLWICFSLPVVTLGASTCALYRVTMAMARDENVHIPGDFVKAFKENLRGGTMIGLIMTAAGAALAADGFILYRLRFTNALCTIGFAVFLFLTAVYLVVLVYVFPLQAAFRNTPLRMIRNAFLIGVRYLFCTLLIIGIHAAVVCTAVWLFTPILFLGEGLCAFLSSILLKTVFGALASPASEEGGAE